MKRFCFLVLGLFAVAGAFASPLFKAQKPIDLQMSNGHWIRINFATPPEDLSFFDNSILQTGLAKLSETYNLSNDFQVYFVPQDTNELGLSVDFDKIPNDHTEMLRPATNDQGLRGLPLAVPRAALAVVFDWYRSCLSDTNPSKLNDFLEKMQKITFSVEYSTQAPSTGADGILTMTGRFVGDIPIFNPRMNMNEVMAFKNHKIELSNPAAYLPSLQDDYFFILEPISDPAKPGVKRESVMVYYLFDKTAPK